MGKFITAVLSQTKASQVRAHLMTPGLSFRFVQIKMFWDKKPCW